MIQKKICLLGGFGVGKTSLVLQFVESMFDEKYHSTLGVKIDKKELTLDGVDVRLVLWDLAGEDEVRAVALSYMRGASGYLLVVDGTRPESLAVAEDLRSRVEESAGPLPGVLLLNKVDLVEDWAIDEALTVSPLSGAMPVLRTSAKTGENVESAFIEIAKLTV